MILTVATADLVFEAVFTRPDFSVFRDVPGLIGRFFDLFGKRGLRPEDVKVDLRTGSVGDYNVSFQLFNSQVGIYVRVGKVTIACTQLRDDQITDIGAVAVEALTATRVYRPDLDFATYFLTVTLSGTLDGSSSSDYLSRFVTGVPLVLGPMTGSGVAFYYGAEGELNSSSLVMDLAPAIVGGLFVRITGALDAHKVELLGLPRWVSDFMRRALGSVGLQVSALGGG